MIATRVHRTVILFLLSALLCMSPDTTAMDAGGAFFIKGGVMRTNHPTQLFPTETDSAASISLDDFSNGTAGFGWELRLPHGWAVGTEFLQYSYRFIPIASPAARGKTRTNAFLVSGKKYFFDTGKFRPYVGAGIGFGDSDFSNRDGGGLIDDFQTSLFGHAMLGVELRVDNLNFMLEAKTLDFESRNLGYDASSTGVLAGMGINW